MIFPAIDAARCVNQRFNASALDLGRSESNLCPIPWLANAT
jgi:hypothetical protein